MDLFTRLFAGVTVTVSLGDAITLGGAILIGIAWLLRLEAKNNSNSRDIEKQGLHIDKIETERKVEIEKIETAVWQKIESVQSTMNQILVSLGELKGSIGKKDA